MLSNPKDVLKTCFNKVNNGFDEVQSKFALNTGENVEDRVAKSSSPPAPLPEGEGSKELGEGEQVGTDRGSRILAEQERKYAVMGQVCSGRDGMKGDCRHKFCPDAAHQRDPVDPALRGSTSSSRAAQPGYS
jgi:hypothetical protein